MGAVKLKRPGKGGHDRDILKKIDELLEEQKKTNEYIKQFISVKSDDNVRSVNTANTEKKSKT